ncbi:uncharacterized protein [Cebidichthys violaceus]|uniref:uncharacterized protein isoform X4 n=1 Tax=Cebidichthys violaceus TaxID=271503 RepID=UPI0035CC72CF
MICWILLLFILTSCDCAPLVVTVTQSSYQAEENHNITLEWTFTTRTDGSLKSINTICEMLTDVRAFILFHLHEGVEASESQDERFAGRVQFDKDVLREGRLRLHMSRLRTDDSAERDRPKPETPDKSSGGRDPSPTGSPSQPESRGRIGLYCVLGLTAAVLVLYLIVRCIENKISTRHNNTYNLKHIQAELLRIQVFEQRESDGGLQSV